MTTAITEAGVDPTVQHFDKMPDCGFVGYDIVEALFGISRATIRRRIKDGKMPAPHEICGMKRFRVGDLRKGGAV